MIDISIEPEIRDRVTLETRVGPRTLVNRATIANLTKEEVWVAVGKPAAEHLGVGATVRVILARSEEGEVAADTTIRRLVGDSGRMIALNRPDVWVSHSRRLHSRVRLAIPAYLREEADGTVASARTTNLSVGGFHCITSLPISVGRQLSVSLMLTPTTALDCQAQVVRLDEDPDDPDHRRLVAAFRFVDLTPADEARVAEALIALNEETDATAVPVAWRNGEGRG